MKYSVWDADSAIQKTKLCEGNVERVALGGSFINHRTRTRRMTVQRECQSHLEALRLIIDTITQEDCGVMQTLSEVNGVGHRVVHGGEICSTSVLIDEKVIRTIEDYAPLAPLHNPANLSGIRAAMELMPRIPHVAVFDTAFFTTMPLTSVIYAVPYEWHEKYRIRRFGFHGTSHLYVSRRAAVLLGKRPADVNLITLHIGNGVSVSAVKKGVPYDHSMGFTPLEGAVMGTRCGDIDVGIPLYVMERENISPSEMHSILNRRSGVLGITGKHVDRRDVLEAMRKGEERAKLAFEIECYRLRKYIGAYYAALGAVDAIVFTAGVGENSPEYRARTCDGLQSLGIVMDQERNSEASRDKGESEISASDSKVKIFVIPTNEELVLVEDVLAILKGNYDHFTKFEYSFQTPNFTPG